MQSEVDRLDGVSVGVLLGFNARGEPLVVFAGNPQDAAVPARTTASLQATDVGGEVALLFEDGDPTRPVVIGRLFGGGLSSPLRPWSTWCATVSGWSCEHSRRSSFAAVRQALPLRGRGRC